MSTLSTLNTIAGPFTRIAFDPINLNSSSQIKAYLLTQGWIPTEYNRRKDEDTNEWVQTSPKLTEDSYGSIKGELGPVIARRNILRHRRNYLKNFEDEDKGMLNMLRSDGKIPANAMTCGTNTGRYKHYGIYCNIPSNYAPLGPEIRKSFVASPGRILVGCDLSGIEMRVASHFAYKYDQGKLMDMVLEGDFHQEQASNVYGCSRNVGKGLTYCILYGGGGTKVASMLGCSAAKGNQLIKLFWDFNEGLGKLKIHLEESFKRNKNHIVNIDGRKTFIRAAYRLLNTLLQSASAIIFKRWLLIIDRMIKEMQIDTHQIAAYHDDTLHDCCPDEYKRLAGVFQSAIEETRDRYNIVPRLDVDTLVGISLDQVH